jgi:hypothetical protein
MKYREDKPHNREKRGSKNHLQKGAFGNGETKREFRSKLWKKLGVKLLPQIKSGKIESTYTPFKEKKSKYLPHCGEKQRQKGRN